MPYGRSASSPSPTPPGWPWTCATTEPADRAVVVGVLLTAADADPDDSWVRHVLDLAEDCAGPFTAEDPEGGH